MGITMILTSGFGCAMGEDSYHECVLLGIDFGPIIAFGSVGPFLLFVTLPGGFFALLSFMVVMLLLNKKIKFI